MTFKEFNEIILKDKELQIKYDKAKETCEKEGCKDKFELLSKAAAKVGYDIPASEFQLVKIFKKELNENELEVVTGGRGGVRCRYDFEDTDCSKNDFCQWHYQHYVLYSCLYEHDGYCTNSDACYHLYNLYYCTESF